MSDYQQSLRELFGSLADHRFLFVRPGGNWGDHFIYLGAEHLASQLRLKWRTIEYNTFTTASAEPGEVIYLQGGGGFTPLASGNASRCLRMALHTPGVVVIQGPCTVASAQVLRPLQDDLRAMQADKLYFITRERRSAEICETELPYHVHHLLNEDTALYLDRDALLDRVGRIRPRMHLLAVREDSESLSGYGSPTLRKAIIDPARFALSFDHWIRIHAAANSILTNRAHSAICGVVLSIPTTMFTGAYHKNRSIWEFSLEKRNVKWLSDSHSVPQRPEVDPLLAWVPVPALRHSWKLDRFAKRLKGIPLS